MQPSYFLPNNLYCVIGWPLDQSLSPLVHNVGFQTYRIPSVYLKTAVSKEHLSDFMTSVRTLPIHGCSVTIPHKQAIIPYLDHCTEEARQIGAVNTLYLNNGKLWGTNTDSTGFLTPISDLPLSSMRVLLLGAGGAARAIVYGLTRCHTKELCIASPSNTRNKALAEEFCCTAIDWDERYAVSADMIVNATPLGMHGELEKQTPYEFEQGKEKPQIVYDIVYNPLQTRFIQDAKKYNITIISGLSMFFQQASAQFRLWTGKELPKEAEWALQNALTNN